MATAKNNSNGRTSRRRITLYIVLFFVSILAVLFFYNLNSIQGQLDVGTAYGARVACSCHYIGGRELQDCEKDFEPGMEVIGLSLDDEKKRVTASVPLIESATAEFREGWGCVMLTDEEAAED